MNRVVVTGVGAVTPLGNTFRESWEAAREGKTGIGPTTRIDTSCIPWKVAGELKGFNPSPFLGPKEIKRTDPFIHYAVAAAVMAAGDAGLVKGFPAEDNYGWRPYSEYLNAGGIIIGSSRGGITTIERALLKNSALTARPEGAPLFLRPSPYLMPATTIGMAATYSAQVLGIKGHCLGISNACSSGLNAIGEAFRLLRSGYTGPVLAGGSEAPICRLCVEGYGVSGALSRTEDFSASRPFARTRDGFVIAEGSCVLVMERLDQALRRGALIYGEITGYANTADAFHQTRPDTEGEVRAMRQAVADAGIRRDEIDYVNAHGTSTLLGDRAEAEALARVFGELMPRTPVSALKSMTGHMLAASGALETAFTLMTLREGIIPPTLNVSTRDSSCNIPLVKEPTRKKVRLALTNSFGFGGVNTVVAMKKFV
ncbi:MAG: beta-ketoacyl-[acyl-carrier-protein] synthase family protein [Candidatus Sulfobium sp.]|jgi:3-oxoacyl-[acyl-carrier-protein] synthase II